MWRSSFAVIFIHVMIYETDFRTLKLLNSASLIFRFERFDSKASKIYLTERFGFLLEVVSQEPISFMTLATKIAHLSGGIQVVRLMHLPAAD